MKKAPCNSGGQNKRNNQRTHSHHTCCTRGRTAATHTQCRLPCIFQSPSSGSKHEYNTFLQYRPGRPYGVNLINVHHLRSFQLQSFWALAVDASRPLSLLTGTADAPPHGGTPGLPIQSQTPRPPALTATHRWVTQPVCIATGCKQLPQPRRPPQQAYVQCKQHGNRLHVAAHSATVPTTNSKAMSAPPAQHHFTSTGYCTARDWHFACADTCPRCLPPL
jgi:hypothetical protein